MEHLPDSPNPNKSESEISPETIREFHDYINSGAALIIEENYAEAIKHFENSDMLEKVGWKMGSPQIQMLKEVPSPEQTEKLSHYIAENSSSGGGIIELSHLLIIDSSTSSVEALPIELQHEISLVYIEEWLHTLQELKGGNLSEPVAFEKVSAEAKGAMPEDEIDIVLYLDANKVPLTEYFLHRYNRGLVMKKRD